MGSICMGAQINYKLRRWLNLIDWQCGKDADTLQSTNLEEGYRQEDISIKQRINIPLRKISIQHRI